LWIFKYVAVLFARAAQHLCGQLRGDFDSRHGSVFRHVPDLIDLDAGLPGQRGLQLFSQLARLVVSTRECAHEPREIALRGVWGKMNAGNSGTRQKLRETFLRRRRAQRHAVQHDLISGGSQQQACVSALIQREAQFFPRRLKLRRRAHVSEFVQARKFQQNVQAMNKRARRLSCIAGHFLRISPGTSSLYTRPLSCSRQALRFFL
jgi:hypothetical protein